MNVLLPGKASIEGFAFKLFFFCPGSAHYSMPINAVGNFAEDTAL